MNSDLEMCLIYSFNPLQQVVATTLGMMYCGACKYHADKMMVLIFVYFTIEVKR